MGLLTIIVGMVFGIARTSLALGNTIVETQNEEMEQQAFMELVGRTFGTLPGNARLDLQVQDSGAHYLSDLTLQNVPLGFTWGGVERVAKAVRLSTVKRRSGYLDIVLSYYENEVLEDPEDAVGRAPERGTLRRNRAVSRMWRISNGACWMATRWNGSMTGNFPAACRCSSNSSWPSAPRARKSARSSGCRPSRIPRS